MRLTLNIFASFVFLLLVGTGCALCHGLSEPKAKSAADQHVDISADGANHGVDMSDYMMKGANGGRGQLPAVKLWLKKSQIDSMKEGDHSWNYPDKIRPDNMHYSSWEFWRFGLSDALLQLISEQATDPHGQAPELGRYFFTRTNSGATCWSKTPSAPTGLEVDISDETPVNESCRSDHYITYGITNQLFFSGSARFLLTVDKNRRLTVELLSSTLPQSATDNLAAGIASLDRHPVVSFPDFSADHTKVQLVSEFILERKPGLLKKADNSAPELTQAVERLGADKEEMIRDFEILAGHTHLAVALLVAQLHPIPCRVYYPSEKIKEWQHVICCLRALRYLTGVTFTAKTNSMLTDDQQQFLDFNKQMQDDNPEHSIHFFGVWMSRDAVFVAPVDAQRIIIDKWRQWQIEEGNKFQYIPSKKPADSMDDWYWYG